MIDVRTARAPARHLTVPAADTVAADADADADADTEAEQAVPEPGEDATVAEAIEVPKSRAGAGRPSPWSGTTGAVPGIVSGRQQDRPVRRCLQCCRKPPAA
ncbi:hypothetical protein ADL07_20725 [Streptomyces sp. NRRL F-4707]|nr:hypothetical protein ADK87_10905 [Streptomyces sp. NRRL F-4711]KOX30186.1 hypothetical protein ADL07_20725 [Streptomyces sp. NRRL F-4707]